MKTRIKITIMLAVILMPLFYGCSGSMKPVKIVLPPDFSEQERPQSAANPSRFGYSNSPQGNTIESAVEISEKYAQASAEIAELKEKNKFMQNENKQITTKLVQTQAKLEKTKQELTEANELIMDMRIEINNWKTDVLGFRDEMRQADIAQLQTLQKVLEILGGEVTGELAAADTSSQPKPVSADPNAQ